MQPTRCRGPGLSSVHVKQLLTVIGSRLDSMLTTELTGFIKNLSAEDEAAKAISARLCHSASSSTVSIWDSSTLVVLTSADTHTMTVCC